MEIQVIFDTNKVYLHTLHRTTLLTIQAGAIELMKLETWTATDYLNNPIYFNKNMK